MLLGFNHDVDPDPYHFGLPGLGSKNRPKSWKIFFSLKKKHFVIVIIRVIYIKNL